MKVSLCRPCTIHVPYIRNSSLAEPNGSMGWWLGPVCCVPVITAVRFPMSLGTTQSAAERECLQLAFHPSLPYSPWPVTRSLDPQPLASSTTGAVYCRMAEGVSPLLFLFKNSYNLVGCGNISCHGFSPRMALNTFYHDIISFCMDFRGGGGRNGS